MALMPPRSGDQTSHADLFTAVRQRPANPVVGQAFFDSFGECQYFTNQSDLGGNGSISSRLVLEILAYPTQRQLTVKRLTPSVSASCARRIVPSRRVDDT